jgi:hypothetical protein
MTAALKGLCLAASVTVAASSALAGEEDLCGAKEAEKFVGQHIDHVLPQLSPDRFMRVEKPGAMITMDYRLDRLRILLDGDSIVTEVKCG